MESSNSLDNPVLRFNRRDILALKLYHRVLEELVDKHGKKAVQTDLLSLIGTSNPAEKKRIEAEVALEERRALLKELRLTIAQDAGRGIDCDVSEEELQQGLQFYLETPVSPRQRSNVSSASTLPAPYEFIPVTSFLGDSTSSASTSRETSPLLRSSVCSRGVRFFSPDASSYLGSIDVLLEAPSAVIQLADLGPVKMDKFEREYWQNFLLARAPSDDFDSPETVAPTKAHQLLPDEAEEEEEEENRSMRDEGIFNIELT